MAELKDQLPHSNGHVDELVEAADTEQTRLWNPSELLKKQYYVSIYTKK